MKNVDVSRICVNGTRSFLDAIQRGGLAFPGRATHAPGPERVEQVTEYPDPGEWHPESDSPSGDRTSGRPRKERSLVIQAKAEPVTEAAVLEVPPLPSPAESPLPERRKPGRPRKVRPILGQLLAEPAPPPLNVAGDRFAPPGCTAVRALSEYYPAAWDEAQRRLKAGHRQGQCQTCQRHWWADEPCAIATWKAGGKPRWRV